MKYLPIIAVLFSFIQCKTIKLEQNPPFKIEKASYHHWNGGQPGVSGTNIEIKLEKNSNINFDSIFFQNKSTAAEISTTANGMIVIGNFNSSKRQRKSLILDSNIVKEIKNTLPDITNYPFQLKENEAILTYKIKNKIKYFKLKDIKKAKPIFFPRINKS